MSSRHKKNGLEKTNDVAKKSEWTTCNQKRANKARYMRRLERLYPEVIIATGRGVFSGRLRLFAAGGATISLYSAVPPTPGASGRARLGAVGETTWLAWAIVLL